MLEAAMGGVTNTLVVQCRLALGLTQKEFGEIFGRTKRTVQRWEESGALLILQEVDALARALHPLRPDLAEKVAVATGTTLDKLGLMPAVAVDPLADSDPIDSVVRAAADAMGVAPDAIRPAIAAAFVRAREMGLDVQAVARGLSGNESVPQHMLGDGPSRM
jgi:transcriptional regulator with XRE-family HTH domain